MSFLRSSNRGTRVTDNRLFTAAVVLIVGQFLSTAGMAANPTFASLLNFGTEQVPEELETSSESKEALQPRARRAPTIVLYLWPKACDCIAEQSISLPVESSLLHHPCVCMHLIGSGIRILC
jgi:hypothetical protein